MSHVLHQANRVDASSGLADQSKALPSSAGSVQTTAFDLGAAQNQVPGEIELELVTPDLTTTELPDGKTVDYELQDSSDNSSFSTVIQSIVRQTGAGGSGADGETKRLRLPPDISRYVRIQATTGTGAGDCSGKSVSVGLRF